MREIKFRGYNGLEWLYTEMIRYVSEDDSWQMMNHETDEWDYVSFIGQYTGLKDKNNTPIYEGDIVEYNYIGEDEETARHYPKKGVINFKDNGWHINNKWLDGYTMRMFKFEVIGNIYDNKEDI